MDVNLANMSVKENMFLLRVAARWNRKAGVNPSSQWCYEPGPWSPLTTMTTAAMIPLCLPAPVQPPLRWSLTSAARQKRGKRSGGSFFIELCYNCFPQTLLCSYYLPGATTWSLQILEVERSATT